MSANELLTSIARSRLAAKKIAGSLPLKDLSKAIRNLQHAEESLKQIAEKKAASVHAAQLKKISKAIAQSGLSKDDVRRLADEYKPDGKKKPRNKAPHTRKKGPKRGTKVAPKYQLDSGGQTYKWSGRGRMPLVFRQYEENKGSLDDLLIKK